MQVQNRCGSDVIEREYTNKSNSVAFEKCRCEKRERRMVWRDLNIVVSIHTLEETKWSFR